MQPCPLAGCQRGSGVWTKLWEARDTVPLVWVESAALPEEPVGETTFGVTQEECEVYKCTEASASFILRHSSELLFQSLT